MFKRGMLLIGLLFLLILLASCSSRGIDQGMSFAAEDIPNEPSKDEIIETINHSTNYEIDDVIEANFSRMDEVSGDGSKAEIYATTQFGLTELSSVISNAIEPREISEVKDNQQILIYPDHFLTLRESEEDSDVLLIEVASDEFVRRNYSPNFLSTYFSIRLLESMLGTSNWGSSNKGGYTGMGGLGGSSGRGNTTFRGGGPGTGK
ncbi:DUF4247 domain-containing protein [Ornithinibacillus sp. L9]|uniref:DUF4247 domain-containing protein n=1 Tax=Ornithinibacillus caprae TaxID=2678566 RepID=A0A6N8FHM5_9BACI|nr:DUF4247 domain-containing protein [Ornithinibacillus caprae]MUK87557.1 DUF4247 domain-containing protein [Ornithinibacillus caprae]